MECNISSGGVKGAKVGRLYAAVLGLALVLYVASCAPGSLWQDSGMIQYRVWHNDIEGGLGLALSHPLFYILAIGAKYVAPGEFAYRVNLVSAIAAAVAVANVFMLVRLWLGKNLPAVIAAVSLAVSHTFWRHGCIAETYTLYIALFVAELIMLLQYVKTARVGYLYWLGLLGGLAIADHMLASIPLLCYAVFFIVLLAKKEIGFRDLAIIVLLWVVGAWPYEYLVVKNVLQTGDFWPTMASAAFGRSWQAAVLNTSLSLKIVKENLLFILLNFPTPNIVLFFAGCFCLFKISPSRGFRNVLLGLAVLFLIFAFRYTVPDRYVFFIPFYCVVSIFTGLGVHLLQRRLNRKVFAYMVLLLAFLPIGIYAAAPTLAEKMQFNLGVRRQIPYRNEYSYFLRPWKAGYCGAERFANEALDAVEDNAIIYADGTVIYALLYAQEIKGKRRDVIVVSGHGSVDNLEEYNVDVIDELFAEGSVYVVSPVAGYCPKFLLERYDFTKAGVLYRAVGKK